MNLGQAIIGQLAHIGVDTIFGIPGVHTAEMYRALPGSGITHVTPRHEQGAAFMADGYARVSGRPGVCMLITGPGLTNAATPIAQAYADSIPMLIITSVNRRATWGAGLGLLHDLPDQAGLASQFCAFSATIHSAADIAPVFTRALTLFTQQRPRPVHIQIPIDVVNEDASGVSYATWPEREVSEPPAPIIRRICELLASAKQPVVIAGGGCVHASEVLRTLIERLDAPLFHTFRAKGVVPDDHPLCGGAYLGNTAAREVIASADIVLCIGTEFSVTDLYPHDALPIHGQLIRIDIDPRHAPTAMPPAVFLETDAGTGINAILAQLDTLGLVALARRGTDIMATLKPQLTAGEPYVCWLTALRAALAQDAVIVGDSTQLVYAANVSMPMSQPRSWLTSVTGYGTLGYALPAAIGAKLNLPNRPVVALVGDGGLQFTLPELIVAVEHQLSLPIVVWHNRGYAEIRDYMINHGVAPEGVNVGAPDLAGVASAYRCAHQLVHAPDELADALHASLGRDTPTLIEVPVT